MESYNKHNEDKVLDKELEHKDHSYHSLSEEEKKEKRKELKKKIEKDNGRKKEKQKSDERDAKWKKTEKEFLKFMWNFGFNFGFKFGNYLSKKIQHGKLEYAKPLSKSYEYGDTEEGRDYRLRAAKLSDKFGLKE